MLSHASRALSRFAGQQRVLEAMAVRLPLENVLDSLIETIEEASPATRGSVLLVDSSGTRLLKGAAPNLPEAFTTAIDGASLGPSAGSCGTAAFRRERVIVSDIASDPLWEDYQQTAQSHGLAACWSTPIFGSDGRVLGTFAQYALTPRSPSAAELEVLDDARDLASVAIQIALTEATLREAEQQLDVVQKMEAVSQLAGGIAHDFNNLLTVIGGNIALALREIPEGSALQEALLEAREASARAGALASQLLTFSRREPVMLDMIDMTREVQLFAGPLSRVMGDHIELRLDTASRECCTRMDRSHFEQALLALAMNSRDAMPDGGVLTVSTDCVDIDRAEAERLGIKPGSMVTLALADTGCGMNIETRKRAFESFFTTKSSGRGIGLGLPTVYSIVVRYGGAVQIESSPGDGATVTLWLPSVTPDAPRVAMGAQDDSAELSGGQGTILLVEDEDAVRRLARRVLTGRGYRVLEARDGVDALDVWRTNQHDISAVVTDVMMPRLGGPALVEQLREERPELPVLFCSGYMDSIALTMDSPTSRTIFLAKPFTVQSLADKVGELHS